MTYLVWELNPRLSVYEADTLPTELTRFLYLLSWVRTDDLQNYSLTLFQLSYRRTRVQEHDLIDDYKIFKIVNEERTVAHAQSWKSAKLIHNIILGTSQLANSSHYDHYVKEQDPAWPQYSFAQNNRSLVVIIGFKQYSFVQNETVDKEYNQSYHQNNQSYSKTIQSYLKTIQSYQSYSHDARSTAVYTTNVIKTSSDQIVKHMKRAIQKYNFYRFWTNTLKVMAIKVQIDHFLEQALSRYGCITWLRVKKFVIFMFKIVFSIKV